MEKRFSAIIAVPTFVGILVAGLASVSNGQLFDPPVHYGEVGNSFALVGAFPEGEKNFPNLRAFSNRREMQGRNFRQGLGVVFMDIPIVTSQPTLVEHTFQTNDLFAAVNQGRVFWYDGSGEMQIFHMELNTGRGGFTTGMALDPDMNLYVTNFSDFSVAKFDPTGNLLDGWWAVTTTGLPESIVRDQNGDFYVSSAAAGGLVHKFDVDGTLIRTFDFNPSNVGRGGTDWMDLAEDNCTMFWTVEDQNVRIYDVCNDVSLGVFNISPLTRSFGLRILPDGGILVANPNVVVRLNVEGNQIQTFDAPGENFWFSLNLAPGCHEFWSGGLETGKAYRFDIESGEMLEVLDTGVGAISLGGLIIKGKCLACIPLCDQRTQGFWRRVCKKPHPEELNGVDPYVDDVVALGSPIFDGFDAGDICDLMAVSPPENDPCRKARRQFAALLLNIASDRLTTCQGITDGSTVQDAIDEIKTLLASGSDDDCKEAQSLAAEINEGTALVDCNLRFSSPTRVDISLSKNSPNPFSSTTTIHYILPAVSSQQSAINNPTRVRLAIYDITGRVVRTLVDGVQEVGSYTVEWNGKNSRGQEVPNGIYFYRLQMGDYTATKKLILLR